MLKGTYYTSWLSSGNSYPSEFGDIRYYFKVYETVNSALVNTSTMKVECYTRVYTHSDIFYGTNGLIPVIQRVMFNGVYQSVTGNAKVTGEYHKTYDTKIGDIYYTANHNEDGSGTISNQNSGAINTSGSAYIYTPHQYINLTKITRGSTITNNTSSSSYKEFGTNVTFTLTRPVEEWATDIYYQIGDTTYYIAEGVKSESISYSFKKDLISNFPNNAEVGLTIYCKTLETNYTSQTIVYLKVPDTYIPTVSLTLTDTNTIAKSWGLYVKTKSILNGVITAGGVEGSTINSYSTSINGETYNTNTFTTSPLKTSGSQEIKTTVTDSRGRTNSVTKTINVIDYYTPSISNFSVVRCLVDGTEDEHGTYGKVKCNYSIAAVNEKNAKSLKVKCGSTTKTFTLNSYKGTFEATEYFSNLSIVSSYVFEFYIVDSFNTSGIKYTFNMTPAYTTMSKLAGGKGVTFGQVATEEGLHSYMDAEFHGKVEMPTVSGKTNFESGLTSQNVEVATLNDLPVFWKDITDSGIITYSSDITLSSEGQNKIYKILDKFIYFTCVGTKATGSTNITVGTITENYRPSGTVYFAGVGAANQHLSARINSLGEIKTVTSSSGNWFGFTLIWAIN